MSAADMLRSAMKRTRGHEPEPVSDDFAQAVARQLERHGIAKVPGLPSPEPEPEWFDYAIEIDRRHKEFEAERARREAEEAEQAAKSQSPAARLHDAIAGNADRSHMALNSAAILRAALGGGSGTVVGRPGA